MGRCELGVSNGYCHYLLAPLHLLQSKTRRNSSKVSRCQHLRVINELSLSRKDGMTKSKQRYGRMECFDKGCHVAEWDFSCSWNSNARLLSRWHELLRKSFREGNPQDFGITETGPFVVWFVMFTAWHVVSSGNISPSCYRYLWHSPQAIDKLEDLLNGGMNSGQSSMFGPREYVAIYT